MYGPKWVRVTNQLTCFELLLPPPDVDLCMSIPPVYSRSPLPQFLTNLALSGKIYCKDTYQNLEKIFRVNFESRSTAHRAVSHQFTLVAGRMITYGGLMHLGASHSIFYRPAAACSGSIYVYSMHMIQILNTKVIMICCPTHLVWISPA